jgi:exodeoxyribonuclease VII small subunit
VSRFEEEFATLAKKNPPLDFESALKELESLVEKMEQGDIRLEDSLQHFERGIELTRHCQQALREAEQKVQILLEKDSHAEIKPLSDEE